MNADVIHSEKMLGHICSDSPAVQLTNETASSAGVERVFASFGLVHSKLRSRRRVEKAGQLVFLYKMFNKKNSG